MASEIVAGITLFAEIVGEAGYAIFNTEDLSTIGLRCGHVDSEDIIGFADAASIIVRAVLATLNITGIRRDTLDGR